MSLGTASVFFNVTKSMSPSMITYPGDPKFSIEIISSLKEGNAYNLCSLHMSNHAGTHIDFPAHFISEGKTSSDFPLEYLKGDALVVEIPESVDLIGPSHIPRSLVKENDIIFFKTKNSKLTEYIKDYTALSTEAASLLRDLKVKIVGIDYLSVDQENNEDFPVHKILLGSNILIVENLNLKDVPEGRYHTRIAPLQIAGIDGTPVTVSIER